MPDDFLWMRPLWLLALIPLLGLVVAASRRRVGGSGGWDRLVDAHLLEHLTGDAGVAPRKRWLWPAALAGAVAVVALAGPSVESTRPVGHRPAEPSVIVMSLAQSMNATDIAPSRLVRAGHKVRDLLARTRGGDVGFVIYADLPFTAVPLTADGAVVAEMLPELSTDLMPVLGDRPDLAIAEAATLLERAGASRGHILLIADDAGEDAAATAEAARAAAAAGYRVGVLGVGTAEGAPVLTASGQTITRGGEALVTRLAVDDLRAVASEGDGAFATMTADGRDLDTVLPPDGRGGVSSGAADGAIGPSADGGTGGARIDGGYWLMLLPLLLVPFLFRRNVLFALPIALALSAAVDVPEASAGWSDWWDTPDQQAAAAFDDGAFDAAAAGFEDPAWRASALYRAGRYDDAAELYGDARATDGGVSGEFNRGNALAKAGRLEDALAAYDAALATDPADEDAAFNRAIVADLLEQQQAADEQQPEQQSGEQQAGQQGEQSGEQQAEQQGEQSGEQQAGQQGEQSGEQQAGQQSEQSGEQQAGQQGEQSGEQQAGQQGEQSGEQQAGQQGEQSGEQQAGQQGDQSDEQQAGQQGERSGERQVGQQGEQSGERQRAASTAQDGTSHPSDEFDETSDAEASPGTADPADETASSDVPATGEGDEGAFTDAMDAALRDGDAAPAETPRDGEPSGTTDGQGAFALDQASEQELRSVPDDPSGLLRARIRRHYLNARRGG